MTLVEQLECKFVLMVRRMEKLEHRIWIVEHAGKDAGTAAAVAIEIDLDAVILVQRDKLLPRIKLARELRSRGWATERISKVMGCSEKTVRRYCRRYATAGAADVGQGALGI